jgi:hypothetical protein
MSKMTLESIQYAADVKYTTMKPKFVATVEVASGKAISYAFLDQINYDFVVRRDNGRVDLLNNDSIVCVWADLKKDFTKP